MSETAQQDPAATAALRRPRLSIIVPSFNQGRFIERTIRSILDQGYPNTELIIIDGGSSDDTLDIIKRYESHIAYWVSEPDGGQTNALNKGIAQATGDLIGWQNSDDVYFKGAFESVAASYRANPHAVLYSGIVSTIDEDDRELAVMKFVRPTRTRLLYEGFIMSSQGVFWKPDTGVRFDESLHNTMDFRFWLQLLDKGEAAFIPTVVGAFRVYAGTKTDRYAQRASDEAAAIRRDYGVDRDSAGARAMRYSLKLTRMLQWYTTIAWRLQR